MRFLFKPSFFLLVLSFFGNVPSLADAATC
jgi:hypothetical protein